MKKIIVVIMILFLSSCTKNPNIEPNVNYINENEFLAYTEEKEFTTDTYYMDLFLDDESDTLRVQGRLVYLLKEDTDVLRLRVYPNTVANDYPYYAFDFTSLTVNGISQEVVYSSTGMSLIEIQLDESVKALDQVNIDFDYTFSYWVGEGRISSYYDYYINMFFYPIIQLDNEDPVDDYNYAFNGESYYNRIADYFVSINTPTTYKVASSGKVFNEVTEEERKVTNVILDDGRDFSFSASKNYHVYERTLYDIDFSIYSNRELTTDEVEDSFYVLENAFETYEEYIGDYPYDYFTLEYGNIYGMESSGIIYCSTDISIYTVVHEIIHQWIYSIIHNDQAREPFLDEALTTYITYIYFLETEGIEHAEGYLDYRSSLKEGFEGYYDMYQGRSLLETVHHYPTGYGYIIYYHGPTVYRYYFDEIVQDTDGTVLKEFLQEYYNRYAYKEVTTLEMLDLLEEITEIEGTKEWFLSELESLEVMEPMD